MVHINLSKPQPDKQTAASTALIMAHNIYHLITCIAIILKLD